jgi:hypothetical protein
VIGNADADDPAPDDHHAVLAVHVGERSGRTR